MEGEEEGGISLAEKSGNEDAGGSEVAMAEIFRRARKRGGGKGGRTSSVCSSVRGGAIAINGLRLRRASLLAGRRRGPSTPVPSWKLIRDAFSDAIATESLTSGQEHNDNRQTSGPAVVTVSARRLAATLWELQAIPFSRGGAAKIRGSHHHHHRGNSSTTAKSSVLHSQPPSPASSHFSQRVHRQSFIQHKTEATGRGVPFTNPAPGMKTLWKDLTYGHTSSNEVLKVLNHVRSLEEQHKSSMSLVASLRHELDQSHKQLQELFQNEKTHRKEVESITKKLVEERAMWQERQQESIGMAVQSIKEELHYERKAKNRLETFHRRVVKEFHEVKKALGKALHDFERERKARELMEDVCDELAREIGEDKARVEELKRESVKVREEVEEERKMLQMAEIWREERVQMKLMEAKLELEEKNAALDKLRSELEAFLKAKRRANLKDEGNYKAVDARQDGHSRLSMDAIMVRNSANAFGPKEARIQGRHSVDSRHSSVSRPNQQLQELEGDDGSSGGDEDDLHSIEINNESLSKQGGNQWGHYPYNQKEVENRQRRSTNRRVSNVEKSKQQWQAGRSQGLQRTRSSQLGEGRRHRDLYLDDIQGTQWIEDNAERDEMREWSGDQQASAGEGREETINIWRSDNEGSQGHTSFSPKVVGRSSQQYEENSNLESSGTNAAWLRQIVENSRDLPATSVFAPIHQQSYVRSSPTRQWNNFWSSPDLGSPRQGRGKGSSEMLNDPRDNSLKSKLLEAKLEGQQARSRAGKG